MMERQTVSEAGRTYVSLEINGQEAALQEDFVVTEASTDSLPQTKSLFSIDEDLNVAELDQLLSIACCSVKEKIDEIVTLKSEFREAYNSFLKEEKERYTEELSRKSEELSASEISAENYKVSLYNKECIIENLSEALLGEKDKFLSYKVFHTWRNRCMDLRREKFLNALAVKHYKERLKRKFFFTWHELTEWSWKERIEHSVRLNIRESQSQLVEEFELKIKNMEYKLKESQIKIDTLENYHKFSEDTMKQALLRGVTALNMETMSVFCNTPVPLSRPSSCSLPVERINLQSEETSAKLCCEREISDQQTVKYYSPGKGCVRDETSQKIPKERHTSLLGYIPMMGTNTVVLQTPKSQSKNADSETNFCCHRRNVCVQRHVTKSSSSTSTSNVMKISKAREQINRRS